MGADGSMDLSKGIDERGRAARYVIMLSMRT
jgi:hypothetical protein